MRKASIPELAQAIFQLHNCDSTHVYSAHVDETIDDVVIWNGEVEIFDLIGHPTADRAYAWSVDTDDGKMRHVAVLHKSPVDSAAAAVRAFIAAGTAGLGEV